MSPPTIALTSDGNYFILVAQGAAGDILPEKSDAVASLACASQHFLDGNLSRRTIKYFVFHDPPPSSPLPCFLSFSQFQSFIHFNRASHQPAQYLPADTPHQRLHDARGATWTWKNLRTKLKSLWVTRPRWEGHSRRRRRQVFS